MKKFAIFNLFLMLALTAGCMKKKRVGVSGLQSNFLNSSDPDKVCPGGVNVFVRPIQTGNSILVGQTAKFELVGSGCLNGYAVSIAGRFLPFNPGIIVDVAMPQTPEANRVEDFSVVALDSSGGVHRGPYKFQSVPFNLSAGAAVSLNFFPSQTISVEGNAVKFFINTNQTVVIQRVYSDEAGYLVQAPTSFTLVGGEWRELNLHLSRGPGGSSGHIKFDYLVNGQMQTAQLPINHNVCLGSFEDDFLGNGTNQALTYRCSDGSIRVPINLSEQLTSFWRVPTGHTLKDVIHGRVDSDNKADLLFFTKMSSDPKKAYFFYGHSRPSSIAQTTGGSFNVVPCSGSWDAPPSTTLPNQFLLEPESGGVSAKVYTIQSGGVRYQSLLSVGDNTCSLGTVQLAPPSTFVSVSQEKVDSGERFSVTWSAANITGFLCRLQKKLVRETAWTLVGEDNLPAAGSTVFERTETQSINESTQYRAICTKAEIGAISTVGAGNVRTVEVAPTCQSFTVTRKENQPGQCLATIAAMGTITERYINDALQAGTGPWTLDCPTLASRAFTALVKGVGEEASCPPVTVPPADRWIATSGGSCSSVCQGAGMVSTPYTDGNYCASGEVRPAGVTGISYGYGTWGSGSEFRSGKSIGRFCYGSKPGKSQKRDNDRTDITVACYCRAN